MIVFKPNGTLNIATEPTDLPQSVEGSMITSGALTRCKNLRVENQGVLRLRDGSRRINTTAIESINNIIVQDGKRYSFSGGSIYKDETLLTSGQGSTQWSGIKYNAYNDTSQLIYAMNQEYRKRIDGTTITQWGIDAPTVAPTVATGSSAGLTGAYNAKYTYARKVGTTVVSESNPSPAGTAVTLTNGSLSVTVTTPADTQVTHIRIYRTLTGGLVYYHDQDIDITLTNVDTTTLDASLGGLVATDHDLPPGGQSVYGPYYDGTVFIIKNNLLYYSKPKQPEYWPATYFIEVSQLQKPGQCLVINNAQVYFITKQKIYYIQGTGDGTFFPLQMESMTGAQNQFGAIGVDGYGIYHTGEDGLYLFSGGDKKITEQNLDPIFRGETTNGIPGVSRMDTSWITALGNKLYFGYASDTDYPTNILVFNLTSNRLSYYIYNDGSDVEIRNLTKDDKKNKIYAGCDDGFVRQIEDTSKTDDNGTKVPWETQSKEFTLQTRAHFPRSLKYDIDASKSASCAGEYILDGVSHQSHALTKNRKTKKRLIKTGNGNRAQLRVSGSGIVEIYAIEAE